MREIQYCYLRFMSRSAYDVEAAAGRVESIERSARLAEMAERSETSAKQWVSKALAGIAAHCKGVFADK